MTAEIVNLRHARKAKERAEREREAAENRIAFGRTKGEKERTAAERRLRKYTIDGHRREPQET